MNSPNRVDGAVTTTIGLTVEPLDVSIVKRTTDVVIAVVALALTLPVMILATIGVKLTSPGPVLFRQSRIGQGGERFVMLKFRTYPVDHVDDQHTRAHYDCPLWFGRFLRRTSIDELPQLFNVLRGEMAIVGPRPERPHFAEPLSAEIVGYDARHRVRGGITGWAQVNGLWGQSCLETRVRLDNQYIDGWSPLLDLRILARTPGAVVRKALGHAAEVTAG